MIRTVLASGVVSLFAWSTAALGTGALARGHQSSAQARESPAATGPVFLDLAAESGLDFVHFNGMSGKLYFPEMTGQGGALFDYDNDGDLDVYFVQGAMLGGGLASQATFPQPVTPWDRLFRNDSSQGQPGALRFVDVTAQSGIEAGAYGMGVASGDFDNDGWTDLYVTHFGPNRLLRNQGDGRFADVTDATGTQDARWSTSATFFDYDRDGWLDLFVVNYVDYDVEKDTACYATSSRRDYCGPSGFAPVPDRLLRNRGDGTFEDVTTKALGSHAAGAGLGVLAADLDGDGWTDLYVANDGLPNHLWRGSPQGHFQEDALFAGVAINGHGVAEASMGVAAADVDADGDEDLFLTHLAGETNTLYTNDGAGLFEDRSIASGLGPPSRAFTGFGTGFVDYDNDGWLDVFVANGAVRLQEAGLRAGDPYPLGQGNQLFRNQGAGRFLETTAVAGASFPITEVSRGAAFGDVDNDGDIDVLVFNNSARARLLVNQVGDRASWIGFRLVVGESARDALGARAGVRLSGRWVWRRAHADGSFASASDPRVVFGLGEAEAIEAVRVIWPDGETEEWGARPAGAYTTLHQGSRQASQ